MIGSELLAFLKTSSSLLALLGTNGTSAFPSIVANVEEPGLTYPQIVFEFKDLQSTECFDGSGPPYTVTLELMVIAKTYTAADAIAKTLQALLDGYSGTWTDITVQACYLEDITEDQIIEPESTAIRQYLKELVFTVAYH